MGTMRLGMVLAVLACAVATYGTDEYYKVRPKRIEQDLYKDLESGLYIQTEYCYEYAYGEDGILKYDPYATRYDNKLIFNSGTACNVVRVFR
jgi:hypothetical protein